VMGAAASERPADEAEIERMVELVREAMDAGAAGFATSFAITHLGADGRPIPSRFADKDELRALFGAVGESGRGVVGINGGEGLTLREVYAMQPEMGAPVTYTALLTQPNGAHLKAVEIHRAGLANGADVWPQVSCRPLSFSMVMTEPFTLNTNPVFAELMPGSIEDRRAAYADPAWRQRVRDAWAAGKGIVPNWDSFDILMSEANPDLVGRPLPELAAAADGDCLDVLLDATLAEPNLGLRVRAVLANGDPEGIALLLREERCTLGLSDAGAHVGQLCDAPLPTDLLGNWVRGRGVLTLEEAVHKLTQVQAELFGFDDRGVIRPGAWADIVVFDPETVAPGPLRRVADFPAGAERLTADQPEGMAHLLVNGELVMEDGKLVPGIEQHRPGQLVRPDPR
jgi:N-acyl-D-amino-acid deacylase